MNQEKFKSIVQTAIDREIEAVELYTSLAGHAEHPNVTVFFKELAAEEKKHRDMLREFIETGIQKELTLEDVPDLKIGDYLEDKQYSDNMTFQDALVLAIKNQ